MLVVVWTGHFSLSNAPDIPGRKPPCRNAAQAREDGNLDVNRIVREFVNFHLGNCNPNAEGVFCQCVLTLAGWIAFKW
jgi:hypothetical protein